MVPKPKQEWGELDKKKIQLNAKYVYIFHCATNRNEFNHVWQCKLTKEIWRLLEITHEGTNQVKEFRINIIVHYSMKDFESIIEMFSRFMVIVKEL